MFTVLCTIIAAKVMAYTYMESADESARTKWSENVGANGGVKYKGADKQSDLPNGANFLLPSFETWNSSTLNSGSITHSTITGIPNGTYTLSIELAAINQNGNINADNILLVANNATLGKLSEQGTSFSSGRYGVYSYSVTITNGNLDFKIQLNDGHNANWILFKNLTISNNGGLLDYSFVPYSGWVYKSENDGDRPKYLNYGTDEASRWQTHADDPRLEAGVKLQRTHEIEHVVWCSTSLFTRRADLCRNWRHHQYQGNLSRGSDPCREDPCTIINMPK